MGNPQHLEWLLEGVNAWNTRREAEDFEPDFEDASIRDAFEQAGKLNGLGRAPLERADLRGANVLTLVYSAAGTSDGSAAEYTELADTRLLTQEQLETMAGDSGIRGG